MAEGLKLDRFAIDRDSRRLLAVDAIVAPGEVLSVMGPSGTGKSTLLAAILGALPRGFVATGSVVLDGRDLDGLPPEHRRIGLLYQDPLLFPHLDVAGNLAYGLPPGGGRAHRRAVVEDALARIGLAGFEPRDPATLSGGQAARVALARTLLARPRALLLDEPFSKLDAVLRDDMRDLVRSEVRARAIPAILVTHDEADAATMGGPVIRLGGRPGEAG